MYIPGFTGALHCPVATQFCALETISGVFYPQQNLLFEARRGAGAESRISDLTDPRPACALPLQYIFWGAVVALCLFFFFACAMPCCRDRFINCSKGCCGVNQFESEYGEEQQSQQVPWASWTLFGINALGQASA